MKLEDMEEGEANNALVGHLISSVQSELAKGKYQGKSDWNKASAGHLGILMASAVARKDWPAVITYGGMLLMKYMAGDRP